MAHIYIYVYICIYTYAHLYVFRKGAPVHPDNTYSCKQVANNPVAFLCARHSAVRHSQTGSSKHLSDASRAPPSSPSSPVISFLARLTSHCVLSRGGVRVERQRPVTGELGAPHRPHRGRHLGQARRSRRQIGKKQQQIKSYDDDD